MTFGTGGHATELLKVFNRSVLTGIDMDSRMIHTAKTLYKEQIKSENLRLAHRNFSEVGNTLPF